jgi:hypothetical protein
MVCKRPTIDYEAERQTIEMREAIRKGNQELDRAPVTEAIEKELRKPIVSRPPQGVSIQRYTKFARKLTAKDLHFPINVRNTPEALNKVTAKLRAYYEGRKRAVI